MTIAAIVTHLLNVMPTAHTLQTNKHQKFVYDGYLCIQRLNGANNAITDLFEWDPTEPIAMRPLYWQARTAGGNYCAHR